MFSLLAKAQFSVPKEEAGALEASIPAECGAGFRPGPGGRASSVKHAREAVAGGKDYLRWSSSIASTVASEEPSVSPPLHDIEINIDEADEAAASVSMVNIRQAVGSLWHAHFCCAR